MVDRGVDEEKRETLRRFAAFGSLPLAGFGRDDETTDTESLTRDAIRGYLAETPGAHFSKLRDDLQLGTGEAQYHLRNLIEEDAIESFRDGEYRRFYPAHRFEPREKLTLGYLRRPTARGLVMVLLEDPGISPSRIADELDVSRATVSNWATTLAEDGIVTRENGYELEEPELVLMLLVRYADSFGDDAATLADTAADLVEFDP